MKNITIGLTGRTKGEILRKINECDKLGIKEASLFLEIVENFADRQKIYQALLKSGIKSIPLTHIRQGMEKSELELLKNNYKTKYFTIHEENFSRNEITAWQRFYKDLYLEMNYDNFVSKKVKVGKIGGFCVDLSHFKAGMEKLSKDFEYVFDKKKQKKYFDCNHLNGYNPKTNCDIHTIKSLKNFDYLKTMPKFVFGKIIALETFNSIPQQLKFISHLRNIL